MRAVLPDVSFDIIRGAIMKRYAYNSFLLSLTENLIFLMFKVQHIKRQMIRMRWKYSTTKIAKIKFHFKITIIFVISLISLQVEISEYFTLLWNMQTNRIGIDILLYRQKYIAGNLILSCILFTRCVDSSDERSVSPEKKYEDIICTRARADIFNFFFF